MSSIAPCERIGNIKGPQGPSTHILIASIALSNSRTELMISASWTDRNALPSQLEPALTDANTLQPHRVHAYLYAARNPDDLGPVERRSAPQPTCTPFRNGMTKGPMRSRRTRAPLAWRAGVTTRSTAVPSHFLHAATVTHDSRYSGDAPQSDGNGGLWATVACARLCDSASARRASTARVAMPSSTAGAAPAARPNGSTRSCGRKAATLLPRRLSFIRPAQ